MPNSLRISFILCKIPSCRNRIGFNFTDDFKMIFREEMLGSRAMENAHS